MAVKTGLLLLTSPLHLLYDRVPAILNFLSQKVTQVLYVQLHPDLEKCLGNERPIGTDCHIPPSRNILHFATNFYIESAKLRNLPDVRILLRNIGGGGAVCSESPLPYSIQEIYTDSVLPRAEVSSYLKNWTLYSSDPMMYYLPQDVLKMTATPAATTEGTESDRPLPKRFQDHSPKVEDHFPTYSHVVIGGTFDHLHVGHKVLLTESAMRANHRVTVGVTDVPMIKDKTLYELIQPSETRIEGVLDFLKEVKPWVAHKDAIVPIVDPFGPSIVEANIGCIVVSHETRKGGDAVNKKRLAKGLNELVVHEIEMVADTNRAAQEEEKVSSSSQRMRLLGSMIRTPTVNSSLPSTPFIIGLTGGIASGKSSVCSRLKKLGAGIIDCDKLGHRAYVPGAAAFEKVIQEFGTDILDKSGGINRRALGAKVFVDKSRLATLNGIVWPEIARMAKSGITEYAKQGKTVCVLDAAVLLDANWDDFTHEVWSCIIPKKEALRRIMIRDKLSEERATQRIDSQMSNMERVARSHVVFCTLWFSEFTQEQVEKAWKELQTRMSIQPKPSSASNL